MTEAGTVMVPAPPAPGTVVVRQVLAGLALEEPGAGAVEGAPLNAGDVVRLPAGTLILAVDTSGDGTRHTETATVHLVHGGGWLEALWTRTFAAAGRALGPAARTRYAQLLACHPPPGGDVAVVARLLPRSTRAGECRWCRAFLPAGTGGPVGHGEAAEVEHPISCPARPAPSWMACEVCGDAVGDRPAVRVMVREGEGRWEVRHSGVAPCRAPGG